MVDFFWQNGTGFFRSFWLLVLLFLPSCISTQRESHIIEMPYHQARDIIIETGWIPTSDFQSEHYKEDQEDYGYVHPFLALGYQELGDCTGMGVALCDFYFTNDDKDKYLRVITKGEDNGPDSNLQTRVIYVGLVEDEANFSEDGSIKTYWDVVGTTESRKNFEALKEILER